MLLSMLYGVAFTVALATAVYGVLARSWIAAGLLLLQMAGAIALRVLAG